ncbi:AI-2E family transporter [Natrononativus amylolyticus]|uniref:AI-2E family transporter n=1 Tax=Natrononativus amylolyticus TaxID=2963434 RepID=UPI0020CE525D|nr:AI-2E family transporter [Natrononativus amylolyticus]
MSNGSLEAPSDRRRLIWWLLALAVAAVLAVVLVRFLGVVAFGLFLYYVARPVARRLEGVVGVGRAAALTLLTLILPLIAVLGVVLTVAVGQLLSLTGADIDRALEAVGTTVQVDRPPESPGELLSVLVGRLQPTDATTLLDVGGEVLGQIAGAVLTLTLLLAFVYVLLCYDRSIGRWLRGLAREPDSPAGAYLAAVDRELGRVYVGQLLTVFVVVVLSWLLYAGVNAASPAGVAVPFPALLALLTGVASFIPLIGRSLIYLPLVVYLVFRALQTGPELLWVPLAVAVGGWLVLDSTIRYGVRPYLSSHGTPSSVMLVAYLVGGALVGWYGVFLAPLVVVSCRQFLADVFPPLLRGDPIGTAAVASEPNAAREPPEDDPASSPETT